MENFLEDIARELPTLLCCFAPLAGFVQLCLFIWLIGSGKISLDSSSSNSQTYGLESTSISSSSESESWDKTFDSYLRDDREREWKESQAAERDRRERDYQRAVEHSWEQRMRSAGYTTDEIKEIKKQW